MRIAILGCWHLGSVTAACLAAAKHDVVMWDADPARINSLSGGKAPVAEPGLDVLIQDGLDRGSLRVEADLAAAVDGCDLVWITQDTHVNDDDTVDLTDLDVLVSRLGPILDETTCVAVSSQVPIGTVARWQQQLEAAAQTDGRAFAGIAYLPENLRLGAAVSRFDKPDMLVIGSSSELAGDRLEEATRYTGAPVVRTDLPTAELVKHAINSFLATSISFSNEIAGIAESAGADATVVAQAMRLDERIGPKARVSPGLGFAGGTLARDVTTLMAVGKTAGRPALLAQAVLEVNRRHEDWPLRQLQERLQLAGASICVLGLTYTVGTSTLRRSQAVPLIRKLAALGAHVRVHDPQADLSELTEPLDVVRTDSPETAAEGCDAIVLLTPWPEYREMDWSQLSRVMRGNLVVDGPNALDRDAAADAGLLVVGPGRARSAAAPETVDSAEPKHGTLSVVIPAYNEEANIERTYERLSKVLDGLGLADWELIFSLDPSTDRTEECIGRLHSRDPRVKLIRMSRRFGQPAATIAGMAAATGDAVVVIDCDLQDPPELIAEMVARWREGFDVVYAQRRSRAGETLPKRVVSWVGYRVIRRIAEVEIPPNVGDFRLMSRRVVENVVALNESHGFLRGLVGLVGFPQTAVLYDRDPRVAGSSKYNQIFGSLRIGLNGIFGFSRYPLQVISLLGTLLSFFAVLGAAVYGVLRIAGLGFPAGGTIIILIGFFSGVQLLALGVMGEYIGRIYDEVKRRPKYIVESRIGFKQAGAVTSEGDALHAAAVLGWHSGSADDASPAPGV